MESRISVPHGSWIVKGERWLEGRVQLGRGIEQGRMWRFNLMYYLYHQFWPLSKPGLLVKVKDADNFLAHDNTPLFFFAVYELKLKILHRNGNTEPICNQRTK